MNDLTLEEIQKGIREYFKEEYMEEAIMNGKILSHPINHRWIGEDGIRCSAWDMGNGIWTGDGGKEMFDKALEDYLKNILVDSK